MKVYYGYQIKEGQMRVQSDAGHKIEKLFKVYLNGKSISQAGKEAGIQKNHSSLGGILNNSVYIGEKGYPAIITAKLFEDTQIERVKRRNKLGRNYTSKRKNFIVPNRFYWKQRDKLPRDPIERAAVLYERIEVEA